MGTTIRPGRQPKRKFATRAGRSAVLLLLVVFLVVASFRFGNIGWHTRFYWPARILAGVLTVICAFIYMRTSESVKMLDHPRDPQDDIALIPLTEWQLQNLKVNASSAVSMGSAEAQIFALATTYPTALRQRISERYEPQRRTMRHTVSMAIRIPRSRLGLLDMREVLEGAPPWNKAIDADVGSGDRAFSIPIPAVILQKGELNDEFFVYGNGDEVLPAYSYSEYVQLAARVLHILLTTAFSTGHDDSQGEPGTLSSPNELEASVQAAEDAALRCILHRGPIDEDEIRRAVNAVSVLQRRFSLRADQPKELLKEQWQARTLVQLAAKFVEKLSYYYAIVVPAECRADGRVSLRYERTVIPSLRLSKRSEHPRRISVIWLVRWSKDRLRLFLGARPVELTVPLENACTCQSFHMTVICPDGLYLRDQIVPGINNYLRYNARPTNVPPYCRLRRRLGQPYAHFYSRFFPEPKESGLRQGPERSESKDHSPHPPYLRLTFYEVPPASMFRAALIAVSTTVLIWLVGFVVSHIPDGVVRTDVPVFLLAAPAIVAAWMGFDAPGRRFFEGTLGARLSLIYSAVCAVAGSGLFLVYISQIGIMHGEFMGKFSVLGVDQVSWGILVVLSALNAIYACYFGFLRTWEFIHLSSRSIASSSTVQEGDYVQY